MPKEKIGNVDTDKKVTAQTILWKKMEDELRKKFPPGDIKVFSDPIKEWFFLRVKDKQNREDGIGSSLDSDVEEFIQKYAGCIDNDKLTRILGYLTNKFGKEREIIKRK